MNLTYRNKASSCTLHEASIWALHDARAGLYTKLQVGRDLKLEVPVAESRAKLGLGQQVLAWHNRMLHLVAAELD